jgi:hypothetical protein
MSEANGNRSGPRGWRLAAVAVVGLCVAVGSGWGAIQVVDALETERCGPYGGGYCGPAPEITVTPFANLVDGQVVELTGRGFLASTSFGAAQCDPAVEGIDGCDLSNVALTTTNENGHVRLSMTVRRIISVQGRRVDCALSACTLGAATLDGTTPIEAVSAPLTFDPTVPPIPELRVRVTIDGATSAGVTGTVTCSRDGQASVDVSLQQHLNGRSAFAYAFTDRPVRCGPTPRTWTISYAEGSDRLTSGKAHYDAFASGSDDLDSVFVELSGTIKVVRVPSDVGAASTG